MNFEYSNVHHILSILSQPIKNLSLFLIILREDHQGFSVKIRKQTLSFQDDTLNVTQSLQANNFSKIQLSHIVPFMKDYLTGLAEMSLPKRSSV